MSKDLKVINLLKKIERLKTQKNFKAVLPLINKQKIQIKNHVDLRRAKAVSLIHMSEFDEAKQILVHLDVELPNQGDILNNLAICCKYTEDYKDAIFYLKKLLELEPNNIKYLGLLGSVQALNNERLNAIVTLKQAGIISPNNYDIICALAKIQISIGNSSEALEHLMKIKKTFQSMLLILECYIKLNNYNEAINLFSEIESKFDTNELDLAVYFVNQLLKLGEFDYAKKILALIPESTNSVYIEALIESGSLNEEELNNVAHKIQQSTLVSSTRMNLLFALSHQYFALKDDTNGFACLHQANSLAELTKEAKKDIDDTFSYIKSSYNSKCVYSGFKSNTPIFIIGMPRSGTTLLENILSSHSNVYGAGETPHLRKCLNGVQTGITRHAMHTEYLKELPLWNDENFTKVANDYVKSLRKYTKIESRIVDKMPHNFLYLGMIQKLFPIAKVIHIKRNPIACCLSIYRQNFQKFHAYGSDLTYLAEYYKKYQDLMNFWSKTISKDNYLEINYENLVNNQEVETRNILKFCELPFEEECLNFYQTKRVVTTASKKQVRNKVYNTSLKPWIGIEEEIMPLLEAFPEYLD